MVFMGKIVAKDRTHMISNMTPSDGMGAITEFRRSVTRLGRLLGASMPKGELSPMKLSALGILRRAGPLSASALAVRLGILPQSLTRILADLESEGLLTRTRDARDAREHSGADSQSALIDASGRHPA